MIIGIAGGSGSGKSTFCQALIQELGKDRVAHIAQDNYYRPQAAVTAKESVNYDHPDALEFSLLHDHLQQLRQGQAIEMPTYDFARHDRTSRTIFVKPKKFIVVEGILLLSQPKIRNLLDLSIFISAPKEVRFYRRAARDQLERGRTFASVRSQFEKTVSPMHDLFVEPSAQNADLIMSGEDEVSTLIALTLERHLPDSVATADADLSDKCY